MFFGKHMLEKEMWGQAALGLFVFCIMSSVIYIINDIKDIEKDRIHPVKCKRPLALGEVSTISAIGLGGTICCWNRRFMYID